MSDTLGFLMGRWSIERRITDLGAGREGRFQGEATVLPRPGAEAGGDRCADYHEFGRLSMASYRGDAERRLRYRALDTGSALITFTDDRLFIECDLRSGTWSSRHLCGDDVYDLEFDVVSGDEWVEVWRVSGPGKCYQARTTVCRLPRT